MSKYEPLWKWIRDNGTDNFKLTYAEITERVDMASSKEYLDFILEQLSELDEITYRWMMSRIKGF